MHCIINSLPFKLTCPSSISFTAKANKDYRIRDCLSKLLSLTSYQQLPRANTLKDRQNKIWRKGTAVQSLRFVTFQICLSLIHISPILYLFYPVAFFVFIYYLECVLHFPISSQFIFMINFASFSCFVSTAFPLSIRYETSACIQQTILLLCHIF